MPRILVAAPRADRITALRLQLPESRHDGMRRQLHQLAASSPQRTQHVDILYDTPTQSLARKGLRLVLTRGATGWLQVVTRRQVTASSLVTTPSWECAYANRFDFSHIDDDDVRATLERPKRLRALVPIAEANFRRQSWTLGKGAHAIEAHLDRGWLAAAGRRAQVSELSLRLVDGDIDGLFDIAERLGERVPLLPEPASKAQRGALLYIGTAMAPTKAGAVRLTLDDDPREAFRTIALDCLAHLHANHTGATTTSDPEYIHQMRVATRRLRAAMRMFRPVLPGDFTAVLMAPLRELMTVLGRTRDLDVLIAEIIRPVADALPGEPRMADMLAVVTDRLYSARQEAVAFLAGPRYARLHMTAARLLHGDGFQPPPLAADAEPPPTLATFADRRLRKMQSTVEQLAEHARADDPTSLHALRIAIKRLRYAIEFFGALLPGDAGARVVRRLATLQDELGQLNDLANAGAILMACAAEDRDLREAVTLIAGWHGTRHAALLEAIPGHLGEARKLRLPRIARARRGEAAD